MHICTSVSPRRVPLISMHPILLYISTFSCLKFLKIGSQEVKSSKNTQFVDSTLPVTIKSFSPPLIFARLPTPLIFKRIKCGRERGAQTIKVVKKCLWNIFPFVGPDLLVCNDSFSVENEYVNFKRVFLKYWIFH